MPRKSCALALVVACAGAQARERGETEARSARDAQHAKRPELREALRRWIIAHQNELPTVFPERSLSQLFVFIRRVHHRPPQLIADQCLHINPRHVASVNMEPDLGQAMLTQATQRTAAAAS